MHVIPFYNRSTFDDVDSWFDDLLWDGPLGYSLFPTRARQQHHTNTRPKNWTAIVRLTGYKPEEVKWECGADNAAVKVHARHQEAGNNDFTEVRRTVQVPDTVDRSRLEVDFTREGILVVKAPYKEQPQISPQIRGGCGFAGFNPCSMMPWADWSDLNEEMRHLHNELLQLHQQSFPGSMASNFVQGEDGSTQLHLDFNMQGFKPEEIHVTQEGNSVVVEAKQENTTEQGSSLKHFKRMFTLPQNVKLDAMTSKLMPNGRLRLEAPCERKEQQQPSIAAEGQEVPVKRIQK
jgi:HSP20 family molecular chaperone IbpA